MLELCGLKGIAVGGAVISPRHANFVENAGGATSEDCLGLMARGTAACPRAVRRRVGARGRASSARSPCRARPAGSRRTGLGAEVGPVATRGRAGRERPRARTASVVVPFPRMSPGDRLELGRLVPSGRVAPALVRRARRHAPRAARRAGDEPVRRRSIEVTGASPGVTRQVERALEGRKGASLVGLDLEAARSDVLALSTVAAVSFDRAFPHTLHVTVVPERPVAVRASGCSRVRPLRARSCDRPGRPACEAGLARMWVAKDVTLEKGAIVDGDVRIAVAAVTPLAGIPLPRPRRLVDDDERPAHAQAPLGARAPPRRPRATWG